MSLTDKNALHAQGEQTRRQLRLLDDALRRVEAGKYGECVLCGKEIAMPRLEGDSVGALLRGLSRDAGAGDDWVNGYVASM